MAFNNSLGVQKMRKLIICKAQDKSFKILSKKKTISTEEKTQ